MDMWHVFIGEVYSGAERVRQKIWTHTPQAETGESQTSAKYTSPLPTRSFEWKLKEKETALNELITRNFLPKKVTSQNH